MDAPTYPPAAAFVQPVGSPEVLSVENFSLAELLQIPAAWAIVTQHVPSIQMVVGAPMMKPFLGNFTLLTLGTFAKGATPEVIAAIDRELSQLPPV